MICLENVLKISLQDVPSKHSSWWRRLEDVLKMSWRRFCKMSWRRLENVLKMSWQDVLKTSWRSLENVLKTYGQDEYIRLDQDVFWRRRRKTSSRRLQDAFIKTNVCLDITNHTKIFYFIALLVFRKFSYQTYWNGLNQVPQRWSPLGPSKNSSRVSSIPFARNLHFSMFVHRVWDLKNLFASRR